MNDRASFSLSNGGLGIRSATKDKDSVFWASWADALPTIRERHPSVADKLQRGHGGFHMSEAASCRERLMKRERGDVARGLQPGQVLLDDPLPGVARRGWQRGATQHIEEQFRTDVMSQLELHEQALFRSQSGPLAGVHFICIPKSPGTKFEPQLFRVLLLRRLWCLLPLCVACCRCGRPLDPYRAACPHAGVLGRRGVPPESAAARVCREAGARVSTNVRVQDMDLPPRGDAVNRRIEVVADRLPLFHGGQLAIDTTLVSPLSRNGAAKRQCAGTDGAATVQARRHKEHTYPEMAQAHGCTVGWHAKSAAGGLANRCTSTTSWQKPRSKMSQKSSGTW